MGEVAYMINWYLLPGKRALDLTLIIITAQFPAELTAGKFVGLSIRSFFNVSNFTGLRLI